MIKVTIDDNTKKRTIDDMSGGDIFIDDNYYYMYINSDIIVRLSDFTTVWDIDDFNKKEYIIYDAEIVIHR